MNEFDKIKVIGKGSYGEVWLAKHKKDKKQYVLKRINLQKASKRERSSAEQEARLLQKLKHPNIVSYKQSFETAEGMLYIAMQYCEGGDLYTKLKEQKGQLLEERQVVEWFVQIAMALQYMHERNILHRDLKTQNIFLTKSKIIKVGDLGIARVLDGATDMATTLIGTPYYMSPELFSNKPYNHKSDVWALGCCVYEMTTLKHAFNAKDMNSLVYKILRGKVPAMPRQYGQELHILMRGMLHQDPEKRPSVNRLLRDPYIKQNIARFLEDTKRGARTRQPGDPANRRPPSASSSRPSPAPTGVSAVSQLSSNNAAPASPSRSSTASSAAASGAGQSCSNNAASSKPPLRPGSGSSGLPSSAASQPCSNNAASAKPPVRPASGSSGLPSSAAEESRASGVPQRASFSQAAVAVQKEASERDEPDSGAPSRNMAVNNCGDAPAFKPGHARRPSNLAPKELEPIDENAIVAKGNTAQSDSEKEDTVKASDTKEAKDPPAAAEEGRKKKKKKKLLPSRPAVNSQASKEKDAAAAESEALSARSDVSSAPKSDRPLSARPLPVPKAEVSEGLPQKREVLRQQADKAATDSTSSKSSSDGMIDETPRSLPNISARDRRRREKASNSMENPLSARNVKLRRVPERTESEKVTKKEKTTAPKMKMVAANRQRQPSLQDSSSSDESMPTPDENTQDREKRRENKEMNNFISLLDNTLKMNSEADDRSDEELREVPLTPARPHPNSHHQGVPIHRKHSLEAVRTPVEQKPAPEEPAPIVHKSSSMPSVDTLACTTRLMERIRLLQKDCVKGVGYSVMKKAYDILDKIEEDEVEPKLMDLLGQEKFDEYAGKIWQLKFCEESLFAAS
ncbi:uncharacterized protein LOC143285126 [Babylonia areolata]|uniref:uncharacterized protein LOC143285126 n=1 Tax=Babylonia areolata TaxID=304850 RepID=UPI003FD5F778